MKLLINLLAGGSVLVWSLICWLAYGVGDVLEDWLAANANWIAGDAAFGSLIHTLLNAGQGLGLILVLIIWAIGLALILIPTFLLKRLFGKRQRLAPVHSEPMPSEPPRPRHSSRHVAQGSRIGKVFEAARKYR